MEGGGENTVMNCMREAAMRRESCGGDRGEVRENKTTGE